MNNKYLPKQFEKKWMEIWEKKNIYRTPDEIKNKQYILVMFPYPSGAGLHVGHVRVYTGTDVLARYFRMNGKNVLQPMGWDAFGLPAENAAIKAKKNPMDMVPDHIATFKRQMKMMGFSYDWDREFSTTDPDYYRWTQWLFIQFFKMGLLYKKDTPINFCPFCKTGLAEEEVLSNGTHERCGAKIEKRNLPQWIFRITKYADRLLEDLKDLDWPRGILEMQRNWIGRKEGVAIKFPISNFQFPIKSQIQNNPNVILGSPDLIGTTPESDSGFIPRIHPFRASFQDEPEGQARMTENAITVFTTALDTIFGVTFMVLAPEHPLVEKITAKKHAKEVNNYVNKAKRKTEEQRKIEEKYKTGVFTGSYCINPFNDEKVPIWTADYVLMSYGTGAVMGVPAHDQRDFEFAKKYHLPIKQVIKPNRFDPFYASVVLDVSRMRSEGGAIKAVEKMITDKKIPYTGSGTLINSGSYDGLSNFEAKRKLAGYLEKKGWGKRVVTYHLRDWIFSRQRYWGEPIPMVFCEKCARLPSPEGEANGGQGWVPIPEDQLPVKLPYLNSYEPAGTGQSPLASVIDWVNVKCPTCNGFAKRETDTMPNWAGSCWYFLRFTDPKNNREAWNKEALKKWFPVDWYIGGAEHAVLHLLYSRFWIKALYDLGLVNFKEPFLRLRNVGVVIAEDRRKMSKSFGNIINPDDVVKEYGADTLRVYEMFMAPFNQQITWSTEALQGAYRFLGRVWNLYEKLKVKSEKLKAEEDKKLVVKLQKTIQKVTNDIEKIKMNTAIAAMMELLNDWETVVNSQFLISNFQGLSLENAKKFLQILAPFAPFMTEEIWRSVLGEKTSIHLSQWPKVDEKALTEQEVRIPIQINGKVRSVISVSLDQLSKKSVVEKAVNEEKVKKYLEGKKYTLIYVKGKILNFVFN